MNAPTLLEAEALARHYQVRRGLFRGSVPLKAIDGVSFKLEPSQTLAVVGESGCGKSTLARQLALIERPTSGRLLIEGLDVVGASRSEMKRLRRKIQMVFQDPFGSLNPRKKVGTIIEEPLVINTALTRTERSDKARDMMDRVGLRPEHYGRYPHMFSGGQRQRIAVARALVLNPSIVVADEPVSALDVSIQAQALNLLMDLQDAFKLAYVFISHDLSVVRHIADQVMVMYLGRPVEQGPAKAILAAARHPIHPCASGLDAAGRPQEADPAGAAYRRTAVAARPAARLRVQHPLPPRHRTLHRRAPGDAPHRRPHGRLPPRRGDRLGGIELPGRPGPGHWDPDDGHNPSFRSLVLIERWYGNSRSAAWKSAIAWSRSRPAS